MNPELKSLFQKQHYSLIGNHAAVKVCHYCKESIRGKNVCYKQKFYGIESHRCLQMTPIVDACTENCLYCWRIMDYVKGNFSQKNWDEPEFVVEKSIEAQKKFLIGFKGFKNANLKKLNEAFEPRHAAISLAGEPTLYPRLSELIAGFHKRKMTTYLVTNGTNPKALEKLETEPIQLYVSLSATSEEMHKKVNRPLKKGTWENIKESLSLLKNFSCNTVVRLTLLKQNMKEPENYAKLITQNAQPTFIECKAYMHVGFSKQRLSYSEMPLHSEIYDFAEELSKCTGYKITDEKEDSRVVLLSSR